MAVDGSGEGSLHTAATHAAIDQQPKLDRAAINLLGEARRDRNRRWYFRNGDHRRQLWQVMRPMRWLLLCWLLLGRLLGRRLDRTASGRSSRGSSGRRGRRRGAGGRRGGAGTGGG